MDVRRRVAVGAVVALVGVSIPVIGVATSGGGTRPITVYVGTASGTSAAYRSARVGDAWTRIAGSDVLGAGASAYPTLVDLDGDGVHDMLVGNGSGAAVAFRNAGSDSAPSWVRTPQWDPGIDFGSGAAPAAVDLDGDGTRDLVVGNAAGTLFGVKNIGTKHAPVWLRNPAWDIPRLGGYVHPAAADIDGDGRTDVVVASSGGALAVFTGTGDPAHPLSRDTAWDAAVTANNPAPAAADLDGDGRTDLLVVDSGAHLVAAFRNTGTGFAPEPTWNMPLDAGSGPGGIAVIAGSGGTPSSTTTTSPGGPGSSTTSPSTTPGGPTARLDVAPASGAAPLAVSFDASKSSDPKGRALRYAWDFGDGHASTGSDADALTQGRSLYETADAKRESGDKVGSIPGYLAAGETFAALTGDTSAAPFTDHGFTTISKISYLYLARLGHDLGDVYTFNHVPGFASDCDRLQLGYLYFVDQFTEAKLGGFPDLPSDPGFGGAIKLQMSKDKLAAYHCSVPGARPMWSAAASSPTAPQQVHTYTGNGEYLARVTVSDGVASATASATVFVGETPPPTTVASTAPTTTVPGGGGGERSEGFGTQTQGGAGGEVIHVSAATDQAVRSAFARADAISPSPSIVEFDVPGPITINNAIIVQAANITVEGNAATLVGSASFGQSVAGMLDFRSHDVIVRDLHLRSGGDNLRAQSDGAYNVVFDHVSSTGSNDDGISIGYGAHDVTVEHCFLAGNTRSLFIKYGDTTRISVHDNWIMKQWIRGPLVSSSAFVDFRNNIVEDWQLWGVRFEASASGNVVNSIFEESDYARHRFGNQMDGLNVTTAEGVYVSGNEFIGAAVPHFSATASSELPAAPVTTESAAAMEPYVRANAGAMPRDDTDQHYIDLDSGWSLGKRDPLRLS